MSDGPHVCKATSEILPGSHLVTSVSRVEYLGDVADTNSSITCTAVQVDLDNVTAAHMDLDNVMLLYNNSVHAVLHVHPAPGQTPSPLTQFQTIGIISGVLFSILFILLCCILIVLLGFKKQNRSREQKMIRDPEDFKKEDTNDGTEDIKPVWTTNKGGGEEEGKSAMYWNRQANIYSQTPASLLGICGQNNYKLNQGSPRNTDSTTSSSATTAHSNGTVSSNASLEADTSMESRQSRVSLSLINQCHVDDSNKEGSEEIILSPRSFGLFSPNGQNGFGSGSDIQIVKRYNPKGLGQFDPSTDVHDITRPNSQTVFNLPPSRRSSSLLHEDPPPWSRRSSSLVHEPNFILSVAPYAGGDDEGSSGTEDLTSRSQSLFIFEHDPQANGINALRDGKDDGVNGTNGVSNDDGPSVLSVFECDNGCFSEPPSLNATNGEDYVSNSIQA